MPFLKHMAPAIASILVWLTKILNLYIVRRISWIDCLDITIWALLSALVSCAFRVFTDGKTLATAQPATTAFTQAIFTAERVFCFLTVFFGVFIAAKGAAACSGLWIATAVYFVYIMFPTYLLIGFLSYATLGVRRR